MQKFIPKLQIHQAIYVAMLLLLLSTVWIQKYWLRPKAVFRQDVQVYYSYLPAALIHKDLSFSFLDSYEGDQPYYLRMKSLPPEKRIPKMTMGMSYLYAPFFFIPYTLAHLKKIETTGWERGYALSLQFGSLIYMALGLFFLMNILRRYYSSFISSLVILVLILGTNLLYYSTTEALMPHSYSFFLFALFVWSFLKWMDTASWKRTILPGIAFGLISLIRPTNAILILVPILLIIIQQTGKRENFIRALRFSLIVFFFCLIVWMPQFFYWYKYAGKILFYSYGQEGFDFLRPHLIEGLFGFRKGWLLYSPVLVFSLAGILILYRNRHAWFWPVMVYTLLQIYIVFSWWCWWYGYSFGQRPMVEALVILAIPLAEFLQWIFRQNRIIKLPIVFFFLLSVLLGEFHSLKYLHGSIHGDAMTYKAYMNSFFRLKPSPDFYKFLDHPSYEPSKEKKEKIP